MIQTFAADLSRVDIDAHGPELARILGDDRDSAGRRVHSWPEDRTRRVASFPDPVLVTDAWKIGRLDPVRRDTVFALYQSSVRVTRFGPTSVRFDEDRYEGAWGPSIDTLLLSHALNRLDLRGVRAAAEPGCGSAFLAAVIRDRADELERLDVIDIHPGAVRCAEDHLGEDPRVRIARGDAFDHLEDGAYDLICCNPPYVPRPRTIEDNPYEGVGLGVRLIERSPRLLRPGGRLVLMMSSLSEPLFDAAIRRAGARREDLASRVVPLKVHPIVNDPVWLEHLIAERGLIAEERDGYAHWHRITVASVTTASVTIASATPSG